MSIFVCFLMVIMLHCLAMNKYSKQEKIYTALLFSVAIIWGFGFVFTKTVLRFMSPSLLNIIRFSIASVIMFCLFFKKIIRLKAKDWLWGSLAGLLICAGFALQTYGMNLTSASNGALLTGLNLVMVPFFAWIFGKKRPPIKAFFAAVIAFGSIALLSINSASKLNIGDLLCFLCAVAFALHFIVLSKISKIIDAGALAFMQMFYPMIFFYIIGFGFDFSSLSTFTYDKSMLLPLFSLSVLSTAYAYIIQTRAQVFVNASKTSLIVSTESLFGAVFAVLLGLDAFSWQLAVATVGVTVAVIIAEWNLSKKLSPDAETPFTPAQ